MSEDSAVVVFTAKSIGRLLNEGGTSSWRLDRNHARQCAFAVCTRNAHASWGEGTEEHHSAFLVGKICDVVPTPPTPENDENGEGRHLIRFSEYAEVNIPSVWKGERNPVKYSTLAQIGIDPSTLVWTPMPERSPEPVAQVTGARALTLADAKKGLAFTFNVPPESIEITIRA
jgi:hypothetical protein